MQHKNRMNLVFRTVVLSTNAKELLWCHGHNFLPLPVCYSHTAGLQSFPRPITWSWWGQIGRKERKMIQKLEAHKIKQNESFMYVTKYFIGSWIMYDMLDNTAPPICRCTECVMYFNATRLVILVYSITPGYEVCGMFATQFIHSQSTAVFPFSTHTYRVWHAHTSHTFPWGLHETDVFRQRAVSLFSPPLPASLNWAYLCSAAREGLSRSVWIATHLPTIASDKASPPH